MTDASPPISATHFGVVLAISEAAQRYVRKQAGYYAQRAPSRPIRRAVEREAGLAKYRIDVAAVEADARLRREERCGEIVDRKGAGILRDYIAGIESEMGKLSFIPADDPLAGCWLDPEAVETLTLLAVEFDRCAV